MKTAIAILTLTFATVVCKAQKMKEAEVPAAVKEAFKKQYPNAKVQKWEKEGKDFEAEFKLNKVETSVLMDASGAILETEKEIKVADLPKAITEYVTKNMPGKKIKEASGILGADGNKTYEAEIDGTGYIFNSAGTLLKKEQDTEKDDDTK